MMSTTPKLTTPGSGVAAALAFTLVASIAACSDAIPTGSDGALEGDLPPQFVINGEDDFERSAVAAIMIYEPTFPADPAWRSFCTATLIHKRVLTTAGHCIQGLEARLASGSIEAAWISFQHDPEAHFNEDPVDADPTTGGWYEIESLHDNPDNPNWLDIPSILPLFPLPKVHDSGAIILRQNVKGIQPMKMPTRPGEVEKRLAKAGCDEQTPDCGLRVVGYGLTEFPPTQLAPPQTRLSAPLRWKGTDPLWVVTEQGLPGAEFGAVCFGDSGGPLVLVKDNGRDRMITAMASPPEDPDDPPCTGGALHYRVDTESHLAFIKEVILQSLRGQ